MCTHRRDSACVYTSNNNFILLYYYYKENNKYIIYFPIYIYIYIICMSTQKINFIIFL